ncbi:MULTISPECIES: hypothetical protein [Halorubrum]|uniref:hypothetical protein n=1 Tax=Halorubrum TaxID=56688 RepID=UPI0012674C9A|nr:MULTISPECIES: hypothetical protein [Halorubrum]
MPSVSLSGYSRNQLLPVMKRVDNWICWARSPVGNKIPLNINQYNEYSGRYASSKYYDREIWQTYNQARRMESGDSAIDGVGFVPSNKSISFIDIDNCLNKSTKRIDPEIYQLITEVNSYTEISDSGRGLHVFCRGNAPSYGWTPDSYSHDISVFDGSWVAVTENHVEGFPKSVQGGSSDLEKICNEYDIDTHGGW